MSEYNMLDWAKHFAPDGKEYSVAKVLTQSNPIIKDMVMIESNSDSGHEYAIQTGIPKAVWRRAYEGVQPTKGTQKVVKESYGRMSEVSVVDVAVAEKGGKTAAIRAEMLATKLESMSMEAASKLINGSMQEDEKAFVGFAKRYSKLSGADSSRQVINNGGTTANKQSSIYLIGWGKNKIFSFFPKGTRAGIKLYDYCKNGPINIEGPDGTYPGYKEQAEWLLGLGVQDWRYGARVCNIETSKLNTKDAKVALYENFVKALGRIQNLEACKLIAYCTRDVKDALRAGYLASGGVTVYQNNYGTSSGNMGYANHDLVIDGIAIKAEDSILETEAVVA